jgi:hypothetical protein
MFKLMKQVVVAAIVVLAVSGPSVAYARLNLDPGPPVSTQPQRIDQPQRNVGQRSASEPSLGPAASSRDAFRWGDAGIGAAGMLILLGGGIVASGAARRRRASGAAIG